MTMLANAANELVRRRKDRRFACVLPAPNIGSRDDANSSAAATSLECARSKTRNDVDL
ncbi:MAG: hypothetical protein HC871_00255 [Rhizobiales bacterium]|nr:hypothetical protein [Hyphomicrobiales bacterium]